MAREKDAQIGGLSFDELRDVVAAGLPLAQAKELAEAGFSAEQLLELAEANAQKSGGLTKEDFRAVMEDQRRAINPHNPNFPNKSVFHPGGGTIPDLPYAVFYNGFPVHKALETHTDRERELFALVQPGEYPSVIRNDRTPMTVSVKAERDGSGAITRLDIVFSVSREDKPKIPGVQIVLYQLVYANTHPNPLMVYAAAMQDQLTAMMHEAVSA